MEKTKFPATLLVLLCLFGAARPVAAQVPASAKPQSTSQAQASAQDPVAAQASSTPLPQASIWADVAPLVSVSNRSPATAGYSLDAEDLAYYFSRPAFLAGGFSLSAGPFSAAMSLELQQDIGEMLFGDGASNLPVNRDSSALMFSNNYPSVGYLEGAGPWWRLSLGRRSINLGRGMGSLGVAGDNPWYDHAAVGLEAPLGKGGLAYDFLAISVPRRGSAGKSLFAHRVEMDFPAFSLGFTEFNLVTGVVIDLQDIGPFLVYHHLFADGSNVMMQLDWETWTRGREFRLYGEILMDDFQLGSEGSGSNPTAMGFHLGAGWRVFGGKPLDRPRFLRQDYAARPGREIEAGGLDLALEAYWASTYLYRRSSGAPNQIFTTRYFMQTDQMGWDEIPESWFAYPLGPDRILFRAKVEYQEERFGIKGEGSFALLGEEALLFTFTSPDPAAWLGPKGVLTPQWDAKVSAQWALGRAGGSMASSAMAMASMGYRREGDAQGVIFLDLAWLKRFSLGAAPRTR